jgi:hypothetical protein
MNETKLVRQQLARTIERAERAEPAAEATTNEIRLLDDLELARAGGGEHVDGWP